MLGDFKVKLADPEVYQRGEEIVVALTIEVLEDISSHFLPL